MALQNYETCGGITIEEDVWIGARALISDGVTIGRHRQRVRGWVAQKNRSLCSACPLLDVSRRSASSGTRRRGARPTPWTLAHAPYTAAQHTKGSENDL